MFCYCTHLNTVLAMVVSQFPSRMSRNGLIWGNTKTRFSLCVLLLSSVIYLDIDKSVVFICYSMQDKVQWEIKITCRLYRCLFSFFLFLSVMVQCQVTVIHWPDRDHGCIYRIFYVFRKRGLRFPYYKWRHFPSSVRELRPFLL